MPQRPLGWQAPQSSGIGGLPCPRWREALERQLSEKQVGALLVSADLPQRNGTRPESEWLLGTAAASAAGARHCLFRLLTGRLFALGGHALAWGLRHFLLGCFLGACHRNVFWDVVFVNNF